MPSQSVRDRVTAGEEVGEGSGREKCREQRKTRVTQKHSNTESSVTSVDFHWKYK